MTFNLDAYKQALKSEELDRSDYIVIVTKILKEIIKDNPDYQNSVLNIQQNYAKEDYDAAMNGINNVCSQYKNEINDKALISLIKKVQSGLVDNPLRNESRRYFETKLSQGLWKSLHKTEFDSLSKLANVMKENLVTIKKELPRLDELPDLTDLAGLSQSEKQEHLSSLEAVLNRVTRHGGIDFEGAEEFIDCARSYSELSMEALLTEQHLRSAPEGIAKKKDRGPKKINPKTDTIYSVNPGIIKSSSPMPNDERLTNVQKNKITDIFNIDPKKIEGFSSIYPNVPFVNSISGSTFAFVGILKQYMEKHKDDPKLEADINRLLKVRIPFTLQQGFHSLSEMTSVLKDPAVQQIFDEYGVKIKFHINNADLVQWMDATADYSAIVNLRRQTNRLILENKSPTESLAPSTANRASGPRRNR